MKERLIAQMIAWEWDMFFRVPNVGGQASCQMDPATFKIMRHSMASAWPEELVQSYCDDLAAARQASRNLMTEKYAWMMESTFPDEFKRIAGQLPGIDETTLVRIEEIVAIHVAWKVEMASRYPVLSNKGRPVHTSEDTRAETSFETYLRGELKTYSPATIRAYHAHTLRQRESGINGVEVTLLAQVQAYGYASLDAAERR